VEPKVCHLPDDLVFVAVFGGEHHLACLLRYLLQHPVLARAEQLGRVGAFRLADFPVLDDAVELVQAELGRSVANVVDRRLGGAAREEA